MTVLIRQVRLEDAKALLAIYQPYVEETAISFEYELPSLVEFTKRIKAIQSAYPYLVLEKDGVLIGYAYASAFHERQAYAWSVEVTIYLDQSARGHGLGQILYQELECLLEQMGFLNLNACIAWTKEASPFLNNRSQAFARGHGLGQILYQELECLLEQMGFLNLNACIAWTKEASPFLNNRSQAFHQKLGYKIVGHFNNAGFKFNSWFDMIWMEKLIGQHTSQPPKIISFSELLASKNLVEPWQVLLTESENN